MLPLITLPPQAPNWVASSLFYHLTATIYLLTMRKKKILRTMIQWRTTTLTGALVGCKQLTWEYTHWFKSRCRHFLGEIRGCGHTFACSLTDLMTPGKASVINLFTYKRTTLSSRNFCSINCMIEFYPMSIGAYNNRDRTLIGKRIYWSMFRNFIGVHIDVVKSWALIEIVSKDSIPWQFVRLNWKFFVEYSFRRVYHIVAA